LLSGTRSAGSSLSAASFHEQPLLSKRCELAGLGAQSGHRPIQHGLISGTSPPNQACCFNNCTTGFERYNQPLMGDARKPTACTAYSPL